MPEDQPTPSDGKRGCPVEEWDGPYVMRCGLGANANTGRPTLGRCAYHGLFEQPAADPTPAVRHAQLAQKPEGTP